MYDAIVPSLSIDITDLLDDSKDHFYQPLLCLLGLILTVCPCFLCAALRQCSICEAVAAWECLQCYDDLNITPGQLKQYCQTCSTQVNTEQPTYLHLTEDQVYATFYKIIIRAVKANALIMR